MNKKHMIGPIIIAIIAIVLGVILVFNLLQPVTNAGLATHMNDSFGNWANYAGSNNLVNTIPLFNALLVAIFAIGALFAILRASGVV